jgi:hypothetical protein
LAGSLNSGKVARSEYDRGSCAKKTPDDGFANTHRRAGNHDDFSWNAHAALLLAHSSKVKLA